MSVCRSTNRCSVVVVIPRHRLRKFPPGGLIFFGNSSRWITFREYTSKQMKDRLRARVRPRTSTRRSTLRLTDEQKRVNLNRALSLSHLSPSLLSIALSLSLLFFVERTSLREFPANKRRDYVCATIANNRFGRVRPRAISFLLTSVIVTGSLDLDVASFPAVCQYVKVGSSGDGGDSAKDARERSRVVTTVHKSPAISRRSFIFFFWHENIVPSFARARRTRA